MNEHLLLLTAQQQIVRGVRTGQPTGLRVIAPHPADAATAARSRSRTIRHAVGAGRHDGGWRLRHLRLGRA